MLTRRQFLRAASVVGVAAAVPEALGALLAPARAGAPGAESGWFLDAARWRTCRALCARVVPTGADPATDPGASEAGAVVFIDRFLSAFELPSSLADNPAIWVRGRWSGRNPFADSAGQPGGDFPPDDFLDSGGTAHFLGLTPAQELSWRFQLYGPEGLAGAPAWSRAWAAQVGGAVPSPVPAGGLRRAYAAGLDAFDSWSESMFGVPYASAPTEQQDLMLAGAANVVLDALAGSAPLAAPSPPAPPPAAETLFPFLALHTFQATYGIPEYSWRNQADDPTVTAPGGTAQWRAIGYDGDTEPLGSSLFDPAMFGPGQGPNAGFGAAPGSAEDRAGVYVPFGGYREFRAVSYLDGGGRVLTDGDVEAVRRGLRGR